MERLTDKQLRLLQALYSRLKRDDDPRTFGPAGQRYAGEDRDQRISWAAAHIGNARLATFSDLSISQASYLVDVLNGKPTKLDQKLHAVFVERGIVHPPEWFEAYQAKSAQWKFRGLALHQLNRWQKIMLVNVLASRGDETNRAPRAVRQAVEPRDMSPTFGWR